MNDVLGFLAVLAVLTTLTVLIICLGAFALEGFWLPFHTTLRITCGAFVVWFVLMVMIISA